MKLFLLFVAVVLALVAGAPQNSDAGAIPKASGTSAASPVDVIKECKRKSWFFLCINIV